MTKLLFKWQILFYIIMISYALSASSSNLAFELVPSIQTSPAQSTVFVQQIDMEISSSIAAAKKHTLQGLNHLHGGWTTEAKRHFASAIQQDPQCLMAYWGLIMTVPQGSKHNIQQREIIINRLLDLLDQGKGSELERGYCYGLIKFIQEDTTAGAIAFDKVAKQFPNDIQAKLFSALFACNGYDLEGDARANQASAERKLTELLALYPDHPILLNSYLNAHSNAKDLNPTLPQAIRLTELAPDYPPYWYVLGHYQARCGNYSEASLAFTRSSQGFAKWMKQNKVPIEEADFWIQSELYRITCLGLSGQIDTAIAAAQTLQRIPIKIDKAPTFATQLLMWEAQSLPLRLAFMQSKSITSKPLSTLLPEPQYLAKYNTKSLAYIWIDGLRIYLEAKNQLTQNNQDQAELAFKALRGIGVFLTNQQSTSIQQDEFVFWKRAIHCLELMTYEIQNNLLLLNKNTAPERISSHFSSASNIQSYQRDSMPPCWLLSIHEHYGDFLTSQKRHQDATQAYQQALLVFPKNQLILKKLKALPPYIKK